MRESRLVQSIHDTPHQFVLALAGGGSKAVDALLTVPGASRSIREVLIPYHEQAMIRFLGHRPQRLCDEQTARRMAMRAFFRARELGTDVPLVGIGCTAGLATDRPRRGSHRVHVGIQTVDRTAVRSLVLEKGRRNREEEEEIAKWLVLNAVAEAAGLSARVPLPLFENEQVVSDTADAPEAWKKLLLGDVDVVTHGTDVTGRPKALLCGSFNPIHEGHRAMARIASEILGIPVHFELTIQNADKPPLDYLDLKRRLDRFEPNDNVWLTRADIFANKAALFPGVVFVVGADTIKRIGRTRFYGGSDEELTIAIRQFQKTGCRFLVFGREGEDGFETVRNLSIPPALCVLCQEVPESQFRLDVSSTELRATEDGACKEGASKEGA